MLLSIRRKIILIYILLILIPLVIVNYMAVENIRKSTFKDIEVDSLKTANIISDLSKSNMNNPVDLKRTVKRYSSALDERIVVLDKDSRILADSFHTLENKTINNAEIKGALNSEEKIGYYRNEEDKNILQVAVPISAANESRRAVGAVLVSVNIDDSIKHIKDLRFRLISISMGAAAVSVMVAAAVGNKMSDPIVELSGAARKIEQGEFGHTVDIKSKDEIGKLAENFNLMSKELYKIDRSRNQFIGDVSHELRTPLASIKALIDSLLYGENDIEVYKEYLGDMDSEIDRLTNLIQKLLNLTKIREQKLSLEESVLEELIAESVNVVKPMAQTSDVRIEIDIRDNPVVLCDPERIMEVLINIIDNSLKYMDMSKPDKHINITGRDGTDCYLLNIEDNGIGIAKEDLEFIFEKFYRSDVSRSRDTGGAGIGLSIVHNILEAHDWDIEVESKPGQGTMFKIKIPDRFLSVS